MVVGYLPSKILQDAFQNYQTVCMVIITIAAVFCLIALAMNLIFLSGFSISHYLGFAAGASEIAAGIDISIIFFIIKLLIFIFSSSENSQIVIVINSNMFKYVYIHILYMLCTKAKY